MTFTRILKVLGLLVTIAWASPAEAQGWCAYCDGDKGGCWVQPGNGWLNCTNTTGGSCLLENPCSVELAVQFSADGLRTGVQSEALVAASFTAAFSRIARLARIPGAAPFEAVQDCAGFLRAIRYDPWTASDRRHESHLITI